MCMMSMPAPPPPPKPRVPKVADPNAVYELGSGEKVGEQNDKDKLKVDTTSNQDPTASAQSSKTDKAY